MGVAVKSEQSGLRGHHLARARVRLLAGLGEALLGAAGLRPPPELPAPSPSTARASTWREFAIGLAGPPVRGSSSGLRITLRAIRGDLARKQADQFPGLAGRGELPPGFTHLEAAAAPGRAPLYAHYNPPATGQPIVILLHGMFDSKLTGYLRRVATALAANGLGVMAPDLRWHGQLFSSTWPPGLGSEEAGDLAAWAAELRRRHPAAPLALVGFSMGCITLVHALARPDAAELFTGGGIAFSPPGRPTSTLPHLATTPLLARPLGRGALPWVFRLALRERLARSLPQLPRRHPFDALLAHLAAETNGRRTPAELLAAGDHLAALAQVRRPLLLISAEDDPVFPASTLGELAAAAASNAWVRLVRTAGGGHIGHAVIDPQWTIDTLLGFVRGSCSGLAGW